MGNYLTMQVSDKENFCQNIYANYIVQSSNYLREYSQCLAKVGKKELPVACYTNFRDALFHFRKMAKSVEEHEILQQAFAVKEHLGRAKTDARISVLFYYVSVANRLLDDATVSDDVKPQIRKCLHGMNNVIMSNRLDGMMMSELPIEKTSEEEVLSIVQEFLDLMQSSCINQFVSLTTKDSSDIMNMQY